MFYTYVLRSITANSLYIGQTNNLESRVLRHNSGKNFATKSKIPWELFFSRAFETRKEAMNFEKYLKSIRNKEYLLEKIKNKDLTWPEKSRLNRDSIPALST